MTKSQIFKKAWEISREAFKRFGGKVKMYFSEALKMVRKGQSMETKEVFLTKEQITEAVNKINSLFINERENEIEAEFKTILEGRTNSRQFVYAIWVVNQIESMFGKVAKKSYQYWIKFILDNVKHQSLKNGLKNLSDYILVRDSKIFIK
jgi:hypothetical protein